jgi:hypothetical protein
MTAAQADCLREALRDSTVSAAGTQAMTAAPRRIQLDEVVMAKSAQWFVTASPEETGAFVHAHVDSMREAARLREQQAPSGED